MFSPTCSAAAPIAGCTGPWSSTRASRSMPAPTIPAPRSTTPSSASTARRSRERTCTRSRTGIDAVLTDVIDHGITADELDRAKNRLIADAVYAQDNQATLARWYGSALATGETVDMVRTWPDRIRAVTARCRATGRPQLARPPPVGDGLSRQKPAARGEALVNVLRLLRSSARAAAAMVCARGAGRAGARDHDRARGQPGRHRSLAGARAGGAVDRRRLRFCRRRRAGSGRQGGHRQSGRIAARRWRGRSRFQGVSAIGSSAKPSN